jgi:hypothetical protein
MYLSQDCYGLCGSDILATNINGRLFFLKRFESRIPDYKIFILTLIESRKSMKVAIHTNIMLCLTSHMCRGYPWKTGLSVAVVHPTSVMWTSFWCNPHTRGGETRGCNRQRERCPFPSQTLAHTKRSRSLARSPHGSRAHANSKRKATFALSRQLKQAPVNFSPASV